MKRLLGAVAAAMGLSACAPAAPQPWLVRPANPHLGLRGPRYTTVTAGVQRFDVVNPKDWRELNREVGPQGGGGGMGGMDHSNMPEMNMPGMGGKRDTGGR